MTRARFRFNSCAVCTILATTASTAVPAEEARHPIKTSDTTFSDDVAFLRAHTNIIVLTDPIGAAQVAIAPAWQGRVMTSAADHETGRSFGWINRELIASGKPTSHINAYGGEDRLWLGPEGGYFSIYFAKGVPFDYDHWFVPPPLDTEPFKTVAQSKDHALFESEFNLVNYSGTEFRVHVTRNVGLLSRKEASQELDIAPSGKLALVAYESDNTVTNKGKNAWKPDTGLLSIWILGMFAPSPSSTIIIPIKPGPTSDLGPEVRVENFGNLPPERLKVTQNAIFFRADGKLRRKIGITPNRSLGRLGSYDADHHVLTIVQFDQNKHATRYVDSQWQLKDNEYDGDVANSYNDGPLGPGAQQLGPFFELESSSAAEPLPVGGSLHHVHRTFHLTGPEPELDSIAHAVLGVSLNEIRNALPAGT